MALICISSRTVVAQLYTRRFLKLKSQSFCEAFKPSAIQPRSHIARHLLRLLRTAAEALIAPSKVVAIALLTGPILGHRHWRHSQLHCSLVQSSAAQLSPQLPCSFLSFLAAFICFLGQRRVTTPLAIHARPNQTKPSLAHIRQAWPHHGRPHALATNMRSGPSMREACPTSTKDRPCAHAIPPPTPHNPQ